ncbi:MAG TPA: sigma 54-interacting transcriptional regulator [Candidatus Binatia bacterium]|nr:sigma 54-interacting transcriptional regulator [Candidatus Binatia bacterium]
MSGSAAGEKTETGDRYRALLDVSSAIAAQPTVKAVLHSLRNVLFGTCRIHGAHLYVLGGDGESLRVLEFDREADAPAIKIGTTISRIGAVARALEEQTPVFLPDISQEMLKHPELVPFAAQSVGRATYVLPVSTAQERYGILVVTRERGEEFVPEDVELLGSLASHVAVALECALARDSADEYHRELAKERDRLRLLLEINNHVVSQLEIDDVFRAASASIRSYFGNDFTGVWLIDPKSNQLQSVLLDFPTGRGLLDDVAPTHLTNDDVDKMRRREPGFWSIADIEKLPAPIAERLRAEAIQSFAVTPLVTGSGPLGLLAIGSRRPHAFGQPDLDLFSQLGAQIALAVDNAIAYGRLSASHAHLEEQREYLESEIRAEYSFEDIVGKSAALREVLKQVSIVAPTDSTVLLHGETGTGKELIARAIHNLSPRRDQTFVRLNCAAIPSGLVESELFGHEKGAFTGALMQKRGRFELAHRGTLFLDEIGDIGLDLQPKLLRALQEHEFERLGSTKTIHVDVRVIAATHRDLPAMIRNSQFREDLFYRLNVFPIEIPPLRERREDIPLLIHYFVSRLARRMKKHIKSIPKQSMTTLVNADWPGNVRELENFIERCVILTQGGELQVPRTELTRSRSSTVASGVTFEAAERQAIIDAIKAASGRIAGKGGAAERLGLKRTTLQNKMRRLNITRADYSH